MATTEMTMEQFLEKFAKEEMLDIEPEEGEDNLTAAQFLAVQSDVRLTEGMFKDGVFTAEDWEVLAKKTPDCENLELEDCGLKKIETPKEGNALLDKIQVLVIGKNYDLESVEFVKAFKNLNTFCCDKLPLLKKKADIEFILAHPTMQVVELANEKKEDEDGVSEIVPPLFECDSEEAFRKYAWEKNEQLAVVNGFLANGEPVGSDMEFSDEEEEEDSDFADLAGLDEEQLAAFLEQNQQEEEDDDEEEEDDDDEEGEAKDGEDEGKDDGEKDGEDAAEPDAKRQKVE